jgi:hypothetical protein
MSLLEVPASDREKVWECQLTDVLPPLGLVDEGGNVGHDGHGLDEVLPVSVILLGTLKTKK